MTRSVVGLTLCTALLTSASAAPGRDGPLQVSGFARSPATVAAAEAPPVRLSDRMHGAANDAPAEEASVRRVGRVRHAAPRIPGRETTVQLSGYIHYAEGGLPAAGVQVLLFDLADLSLVSGATTDGEGLFTIPSPATAAPDRAEGPPLPSSVRLQQNYPNPFNPTTVMPYRLARPTHVRLEVFNLLGQRIRTLVDEVREAGDHQVLWHARDDHGRSVAAGLYVYRIAADGFSEARSMVLVDGPTGPSPALGRFPAALVGGPPEPSPGVYGLTVYGRGVVIHVEPELRINAHTAPLLLQVERAGCEPSAKLTATPRLGDVNNDGAVNIVDALIVATYGLNPGITVPNDGDIRRGDLNGDGRINIVDALIVASYSVHPENPALPPAIGLGPGIVVNATRFDREGIEQLPILPGDTLAVRAASHLGTRAPAFAWHSDNPSVVAVEADPADPSNARVLALGNLQQAAVVTVEDAANGYSSSVAVRLELTSVSVGLPGGASMEFVLIHPGTFTMGSLPPASPSEVQHEVTIGQSFYLGRYEITQAQWESVMGQDPWWRQQGVQPDPHHPAVYVSWDDVQQFIQRLNEAAGGEVYRLPTEAEWEYAGRAGTTTRWSYGEDKTLSREHAWYRANASHAGEEYAHAVGTKQPNPWGLFDVHGNVWEWVHDWYSVEYYRESPAVDPPGPASGQFRLVRGGSYRGDEWAVRSARRARNDPTGRYADGGVRLVRAAGIDAPPGIFLSVVPAHVGLIRQSVSGEAVGVEHLTLQKGDTVGLRAASRLAIGPAQYDWNSTDTRIVVVEPDTADFSTAYVTAVGDSGQVTGIVVDDAAHGVTVRVSVLVVAEPPLPAAPIAYYPFNGNADDASGNGNHGKPVGATLTRDRFGRPESAYYFDGDDHIRIENHAAFNGMSSFTLAAWVYPTHFTRVNSIVSKATPNRDFYLSLQGPAPGAAGLAFWSPDGQFAVDSGQRVPADTWSHVAGVWNGGELRVYVNGDLAGSEAVHEAQPAWTGTVMQIGLMSVSDHFHGKIDEVCVYDRVLEDAEIRTLYGGG